MTENPDVGAAVTAAPRRRLSPMTVLTIALLALPLALVAFVANWQMRGGDLLIVESPSMGTAAPVGTLLWIRPVDPGDLQIGDVISFRPPTGTTRIYTHRIVAIDEHGALSTQGDINSAADPWQLSESDVIGTVAMRWWAIGWLVKALPLLLIGSLVLAILVRRFTAQGLRVPVATAGSAFLLSLAIFVIKPLLRADQVAFMPEPGGARATYVSSGLLPLRVAEPGGGHVDLRAGEVGSVSTTTDVGGRFQVHLDVHIAIWWWAVLVVVCFLPPLYYLSVGERPSRTS